MFILGPPSLSGTASLSVLNRKEHHLPQVAFYFFFLFLMAHQAPTSSSSSDGVHLFSTYSKSREQISEHEPEHKSRIKGGYETRQSVVSCLFFCVFKFGNIWPSGQLLFCARASANSEKSRHYFTVSVTRKPERVCRERLVLGTEDVREVF